MTTSYHKLPHELLAPGTSIHKGTKAENASVKLEDKAELVYTDFVYTRPFTVSSTTTIDQINDKMIACGVRLLFVSEADDHCKGWLPIPIYLAKNQCAISRSTVALVTKSWPRTS